MARGEGNQATNTVNWFKMSVRIRLPTNEPLDIPLGEE
jgi:hypothetical protein